MSVLRNPQGWFQNTVAWVWLFTKVGVSGFVIAGWVFLLKSFLEPPVFGIVASITSPLLVFAMIPLIFGVKLKLPWTKRKQSEKISIDA
jgi:hypothetical protein